jgi:hypothetical protein
VWVLSTDPGATRHAFDVLGLHRTSAGVLPLFLIYLAVLVHNYVLAASQPSAAPGYKQGCSVLGLGASSRSAPAAAAATDGADGAGGGAALLVAALQGWVGKLWVVCRFMLAKASYHIRCARLTG